MKKLEELVLPNMELIDRYLGGEMAPVEADQFHARLEMDIELQEDLEMTKRILGYTPIPWWAASSKKHSDRYQYMDFEQQRLYRKREVGRDLISYGLAVVATVAIMTITCAVIMYFLS